MRHACRLLEVNRSSVQYQKQPDKNADLREALRAFSEKKRRRGAVKAHDYLRRKGIRASKNRIHRLSWSGASPSQEALLQEAQAAR